MVLVHIICESQSQALKIVDLLIDQRLMLDAMVSEKLLFKRLKSSQTFSQDKVLVMGTTKALLFNTINREIRKEYPHSTPLIYAMPIVYMDSGQTEELQEETVKV